MDMQDLTTTRRSDKRKSMAAPRFAQRKSIAHPQEVSADLIDDRELLDHSDDEIDDPVARQQQLVHDVARELTDKCRDTYRCAWNMP